MHVRIGRQAIALGCALTLMAATCTNTPLAEWLASGANQDRVDLTKTPFGAIFTLPNWPNSTDADYAEAYAKLRSLGTIISYVWEWLDGDTGLVHATRVVEEGRNRGFDVLLQLGPQRLGEVTPPSGLGVASFRDPLLRDRFVNDAVRLAKLEPKWLVLATEVNLLLRAQPEEFDLFADVYRQAYTRVKEIAPDTLVGVSYNLLAFLTDGQFDIIDQMGPQDFIGITTYPDRLVAEGTFESVESFPVEYYSGLRDLAGDRPIAITEMGWTTFDEEGEDRQRTYITRLPELLRDIDPILVCWAMLFDAPAFDTRLLTDSQADAIRSRFGVEPEVLFARLNQLALLTPSGEAKPGYFAAMAVFGGDGPAESR